MFFASMRYKAVRLAVMLAFILNAGAAMALEVRDVRIGLHPDKTRLVMELDEISRFKTYVLDDPWRLVIDMPEFDWRVGAIAKPTKSAVKTIRQGPLQPGFSRIVVDLKRPVSIEKAFLLREHEGRPDRLVIDFSDITEADYARERGRTLGILDVPESPGSGISRQMPEDIARTASKPAASPPQKSAPTAGIPQDKPVTTGQPPGQQAVQYTARGMILPPRKPYTGQTMQAPVPSPSQPLSAPLAPRSQGGKRIIVIDPGHGGVDPGAIGANGIFEKHIALSMAKELRSMLEATGRYEVVLTRERDVYKRLYQRVDFARSQNADLFISLHADTIGKSDVRGASVYTLSDKASDAQTAKLAEQENKADIIAGTDLSHEDEQVANILIDMAVTDTKNQSNFFAETVVGSLKNTRVKVLEKPHRSAGFAVLKAPDIPSVLIEIGFMSNREEAQMLSRPEYRYKIALGIASGIDTYFEQLDRNNRI